MSDEEQEQVPRRFCQIRLLRLVVRGQTTSDVAEGGGWGGLVPLKILDVPVL